MGEWYELNAKKTVLLILTAIITLTVFAGLGEWAKTIDVSILPESAQPILTVVITFMTSGGVTFAITISRNVVGYLRNYVKEEYAEEYDFKQLYGTWFYYFGIIGTAITVVETMPIQSPYKELILAITTLASLILDFTLSELKKLET